MPSVYVRRDLILAQVTSDKRPVTNDAEFDKVCFEFGIENDGVVPESKIKSNSQDPDRPYYKIDVPANRYDLLCFEGIARSLRIFLGLEQPPMYKIVPPSGETLKLVQSAETLAVRPFVACAVLRGITMTPEVYASFIDLQDKLHFNIGRRRTLVAIGTHDLDLIQGPFTYSAEPYDAIKFVALNETKETTVTELFQAYTDAKSHHLKPYIGIAAAAQPNATAPVHPVIRDATGQVLSLPPVINSEYSKISLNTRNIFIECTGTDFTKLNIVLNTIIAMFSGYASTPFTVEPVLVSCPASLPLPPATSVPAAPGATPATGELLLQFPHFEERVFTTTTGYINSGLGLNLTAADIVPLLRSMQLDTVLDEDITGMASLRARASGPLLIVPPVLGSSDVGETIFVRAPITRTDVLHPIDVQEDVAIAYGYDNLPTSLPPTATVGGETSLGALADKIRERVAQEYVEVMTWVLVQKEENTTKLRRPADSPQVLLADSKTDFTACRTTLIPGLLKVVEANMSVELPIDIFECGDVVEIDASRPEGARNRRHLGLLHYGTSSGFDKLHGSLALVMRHLSVPFVPPSQFKVRSGVPEGTRPTGYTIRPLTSGPAAGTFLPDRAAEVVLDTGAVLGHFGIVHPEVQAHFSLEKNPVSALDIDLELLL